MRTTAILLGLVWGLVAVPATFADKDDKDSAVKEISLKDLKRGRPDGDVKKPTEIKTADDLAKAFPEKEVREQIEKQVDFKAQKLLFFAWSGSGQDKLTAGKVEKTNKGPVVEFTYAVGRTDDLRGHLHLFAVPKDAEWRFAGK
jgi:hypothetical protein